MFRSGQSTLFSLRFKSGVYFLTQNTLYHAGVLTAYEFKSRDQTCEKQQLSSALSLVVTNENQYNYVFITRPISCHGTISVKLFKFVKDYVTDEIPQTDSTLFVYITARPMYTTGKQVIASIRNIDIERCRSSS